MKKNAAALSVGFLFDDTLDNDAGVAQYVKRIGGWLADHGHQVDYIVGQSSIKRPEGRVYSAAHNMNVIWAGNRLSMPIWPKRQLINEIVESNKYDILHVMAPYSPFMSELVINRAAPTTAVIASWHIFPAGQLSVLGSRLLKLLYGHSLRRINQHLSVSSAAAAYAKQAFGIESQISPNVIDVQKFQPSATVRRIPGRIVFLGRLVPRKGCAELIKALALMLRKTDRKFELVIAGDGPQRTQLESLVVRLDLSKHISFLGYIDESAKADLLASAEIACFPSIRAESFGIVLIEAMAAGSGVVLGGDNPGYRTVLGDQPSLLVNPQQTTAMAKRLDLLLSDHKLADDLHRWQLATVQQYDINKVGPQLETIYRRTIAKRLAAL